MGEEKYIYTFMKTLLYTGRNEGGTDIGARVSGDRGDIGEMKPGE